MKIIIVGASGTMGKHLAGSLEKDHEIIRAGSVDQCRQPHPYRGLSTVFSLLSGGYTRDYASSRIRLSQVRVRSRDGAGDQSGLTGTRPT